MTGQTFTYQPGAMLHDAIVGAFRAQGGSFEQWCKDSGIASSIVRNVTYGQMKGPKGQKVLAQLIEDAGSEVVRAGYITRLRLHAASLPTEGVA